MGTADFIAFSDGYIIGEFNKSPWQKFGDKGDYEPGNAWKRLTGLDDGPISFCVVPVLACTWLLKIFVAYRFPSERPDNAVAFPLIFWNGSGQRMIFARPALTGLPCKLVTQRSWFWQACRQKRLRRGQIASEFTYLTFDIYFGYLIMWQMVFDRQQFPAAHTKESILTCRPHRQCAPLIRCRLPWDCPPPSWFLVCGTPLVYGINGWWNSILE